MVERLSAPNFPPIRSWGGVGKELSGLRGNFKGVKGLGSRGHAARTTAAIRPGWASGDWMVPGAHTKPRLSPKHPRTPHPPTHPPTLAPTHHSVIPTPLFPSFSTTLPPPGHAGHRAAHGVAHADLDHVPLPQVLPHTSTPILHEFIKRP